jgi:hypothetical protein
MFTSVSRVFESEDLRFLKLSQAEQIEKELPSQVPKKEYHSGTSDN